MQPIIDALHDPGLADSAASVIGIAAANNPKFQSDLLEAAPDIFDTLVKVRDSMQLMGFTTQFTNTRALSARDEYIPRLDCVSRCLCYSLLCYSLLKLLFAFPQMLGHPQWRSAEKGLRCAAALVRNQESLLGRFLEGGGCAAAQKLLTATSAPSRLRALALDLLTDLYPKNELVRAQLQSQDSCRAAVALLQQPDRDVQVGGVLPIPVAFFFLFTCRLMQV